MYVSLLENCFVCCLLDFIGLFVLPDYSQKVKYTIIFSIFGYELYVLRQTCKIFECAPNIAITDFVMIMENRNK